MLELDHEHSATGDQPAKPSRRARQRRSGWRIVGIMLLALAALLGAARIFLPTAVRWYVNRVIDRSPLYDGSVGDIDLYLWRGAYSIEDVRIVKTTGNVPVPLFASPRVDFSLQWDALLHRKLVGQITMHRPQLNFVDGQSQGEDQTGAGGPWLEIIRDLFPFKINSAELHDASIHFRAFDTDPPVDVYLGELRATITNLTNIHDELTPLVATVQANGLAMDQARFEYVMKLDPFSYRPTFELAIRLLGLDVTRTNALARAYGAFDFERGWFDLVVELNASEGQVKGYVKPLFRKLKVLSLSRDIPEDNVLEVFWEALVGTTTELLENQPRDQFGTMISLRGDLTDPDTNLLEIIGNILRNAFIRAYLPRLQGTATQIDWLQFSPAQVSDPDYPGD